MTRTAPWLIGLGLFGYPIWASVAAILAPSAGSLGGYLHRASILFLALPILVGIIRKRISLPKTDFWWILGAVWLGLLLRLMHEVIVGNAMPLDAAPSRVIMLFLGSMVLPTIAFAAFSYDDDSGRRALEKTTYVVWVASALAAVAALYLARGYAAQLLGRASTETMSPIVVGHLGVSCAIVSAFAARPERWFFVLRMLFFALGLTLMAMSGSRGPLLVLTILAAIGGLRFLVLKRGLWAPLWPAVITVAMTFPLILESPLLANTPVAQRLAMSSIINQRLSGRANFIPETLELFWTNPLLGAGMSEPLTKQHPHNLVLEAFLTMGILGGVVFCFMAIYTVWKCLPSVFSVTAWSWAAFLFLQHFMFGLLSSSLYLLDQFWYLTAMVIAHSVIQFRSQKGAP